jgi:hypothetical protein
VEILLWLVPPLVVTVSAMAWASWVGRAGRGHVSRDEALRRMGEVLDREPVVSHTVRRARERSTGVTVRRSTGETATDEPDDHGQHDKQSEQHRRAS